MPVNGYWLVDGEEPEGNPKVIYQSSSTGERADGFRVIAAKGSKSIFDPIDPTSITVTAYARCLVVDNSNS